MSEFRIDQIKSQDATRGPDVAGITTFTGTSGIVMPSGTAHRLIDHHKEFLVESQKKTYFYIMILVYHFLVGY